MVDDLVGVLVTQTTGQLLIVQRRSEACETIRAIAETQQDKLLRRDIVGNPHLIATGSVETAGLVSIKHGDELRKMLEPIPPGFDLEALVPEALEREAKPAAASERRMTAADEDPIEAITSRWGAR